MNIKRSLSSHQKYYLRQVCSGQMVIARSATSGRYIWQAGADFVYTVDGSKARGKHARWGDHLRSSIIELRQRGFLVDDGVGRLVPSKEVAKTVRQSAAHSQAQARGAHEQNARSAQPGDTT